MVAEWASRQTCDPEIRGSNPSEGMSFELYMSSMGLILYIKEMTLRHFIIKGISEYFKSDATPLYIKEMTPRHSIIKGIFLFLDNSSG